MHIISSVNDIATYLQNNHPDLEKLLPLAVGAIRDADHPRYGSDWSTWLDEHARAIVEDVAAAPEWDYEGYWYAVIGAYLKPRDVLREFELEAADEAEITEWLIKVEREANDAEAGRRGTSLPPEWIAFRARALAELVEALEAANVTTEQIAALRDEAGAAGDLEQVELCERALAGEERAALECRRVILDARAQS